MVRVRLTESQLRRIIYEELLDHYLVQKELWGDREKQDRPTKMDSPINKGHTSA